jgi:hypothetical protein
MEVAGGQLRESADPYRLVLSEQSREPAGAGLEALLAAIEATATTTEPGRFLIPAPPVPRSFKAYDAKATFDGRTVGFHWFRTGAATAKWNSGDQSFPVEQLAGVEWRSPDRVNGHLRLLQRDPPTPRPPADRDPASVVFGLGYGSVHESLPFAAAVLSAIRTTRVRP